MEGAGTGHRRSSASSIPAVHSKDLGSGAFTIQGQPTLEPGFSAIPIATRIKPVSTKPVRQPKPQPAPRARVTGAVVKPQAKRTPAAAAAAPTKQNPKSKETATGQLTQRARRTSIYESILKEVRKHEPSEYVRQIGDFGEVDNTPLGIGTVEGRNKVWLRSTNCMRGFPFQWFLAIAIVPSSVVCVHRCMAPS